MNEWRAGPVGDGGAGQPVDVPGRPAACADEAAVRYATTLPDPRDPGDDVATLVFRGLYAHSQVSVTGDRVGGEGDVSHDAYFAPLRIPVRPAEETDIVVTCEAPRDRFGGIHDTDLVPAEAAVPGIWWESAVETHPLPYVDRVRVRPELTDGGARLHVRTTVVGGPGVDHDAAAYYPGWHYGDASDIGGLLEQYPADLLAEFGAAALAGDGSASAVRASQAVQADVVSTVVASARRPSSPSRRF